MSYFSTFDKYSWLLVLISVLISMAVWVFQILHLQRTIPVEGSRDTTVVSLPTLHFSGSVKDVWFRWALLCNSHVFYGVTPMQVNRHNKYQLNWIRFRCSLKVCSISWLTHICVKSQSSSWSFKEKWGFLIWNNYSLLGNRCFLCTLNCSGRTNDLVSHRWNMEKFQ